MFDSAAPDKSVTFQEAVCLAEARFGTIGTVAGPKVWAFVSNSANIAKENGYAILKPPSGDAVIGKENGYAILKPPNGDAVTKQVFSESPIPIVRAVWPDGIIRTFSDKVGDEDVELEVEEKFPDRNMMIICHCGGGGRSALAAESLQKMGYKNVRSMAGGFKAWKAAGLPITK